MTFSTHGNHFFSLRPISYHGDHIQKMPLFRHLIVFPWQPWQQFKNFLRSTGLAKHFKVSTIDMKFP